MTEPNRHSLSVPGVCVCVCVSLRRSKQKRCNSVLSFHTSFGRLVAVEPFSFHIFQPFLHSLCFQTRSRLLDPFSDDEEAIALSLVPEIF